VHSAVCCAHWGVAWVAWVRRGSYIYSTPMQPAKRTTHRMQIKAARAASIHSPMLLFLHTSDVLLASRRCLLCNTTHRTPHYRPTTPLVLSPPLAWCCCCCLPRTRFPQPPMLLSAANNGVHPPPKPHHRSPIKRPPVHLHNKTLHTQH
jgi:hypothetical protein